MTRPIAGCTLLLLLTQLAACQTPEAGPCRLGHAGDVPIEIVDYHLISTVVIDGTGLEMMIDTGANLTGVTEQAAGRLHAKLLPSRLRMTGIGGSRPVSFFVTKSLQLGGLHGTHLPISVAVRNRFPFPL